jgi:hypothetical protein
LHAAPMPCHAMHASFGRRLLDICILVAGWGGYLSNVAKDGMLPKAYLDPEEAAISMVELDSRLEATDSGLKTKGGNWKGSLKLPRNRILAYASEETAASAEGNVGRT